VTQAVQSADASIVAVFDAYRAAVYAKDVLVLVGLYDVDVRVFDLWGRWSYDGIAAWRGMVDGWFSSLGTERVVVGFDDVQVVEAAELAVAHAFVTYQGESAAGESLRSMSNRLTWVLGRRDGLWKIVHEHTSAPVDPESATVLLRR